MGGTWVQQENGNWRCEGSEGEHLPSKQCWTQGNPGDLVDTSGSTINPFKGISRRRSLANGNASRRPLYPSTDTPSRIASMGMAAEQYGLIPLLIIGAAVYYFFFRK